MAHPNIAALTSLHAGTLSWNIPDSAVRHYYRRHDSDNYVSSYTADYTPDYIEVQVASSGLPSVNTMWMGAVSGGSQYDGSNTISNPRCGNVGALDTATAHMTNGRLRTYYKLAPDTGTVTSTYTVVSGNTRWSMGAMSFYNVDQTNPFVFQYYDSTALGLASSGANRQNLLYSSTVGDNGIWAPHGSMYVGIYSPGFGSQVTANSESIQLWNRTGSGGTSYPDAQACYIQKGNGSFLALTAWQTHHYYGGNSSYASRNTYSNHAVIRPDESGTLLFTVPTHYSIKVTGVYVSCNMSDSYASLKLKGLAAGTTSIVASDGSTKVIEATGSVAENWVVRNNQLDRTSTVNLIDAPIYMVEGDSLYGVYLSGAPEQWKSDEYANVTVSFESLAD